MIPIILSGGSGTRLWPLSRSSYPKQFLAITDHKTLFQLTLDRITALRKEISDLQSPIIIANENHRFIVAEQLRQHNCKATAILLEPVGKNTAPAIAAAAEMALTTDEDPILLVLAADHVIKDQNAFNTSLKAGLEAAKAGKLVTFGVVPNAPETGYGYIKTPEKIEFSQGPKAYDVECFVEKPNKETAERYLVDGCYLWNSGMFMFKASTYLKELEKFSHNIALSAKNAFNHSTVDLDFIRLDREAFNVSPEDSIDYAVMEKTDKAVVVPLQAHWSDVGAWHSVWEVSPKDTHNNSIHGDVVLHNVSNSLVRAESRLVTMLGLEDVIVIETPDAVLVANKHEVQDVKKIIEQLKTQARPEVDSPRKVFRPWGHYDSINQGERYQVKCITVNPGQKLSLQMHHHRAEHWIIVSGTAKVRIDEKTVILSENQSTYIPLGSIHSLENPGKIPLELIEIQSGPYLGEDDIVRFEDIYGRS